MDSKLSTRSINAPSPSSAAPSQPDSTVTGAQDFFLKSKAMRTFQNSALDKLEEFKNANKSPGFKRMMRPGKPVEEAATAIVSRMDMLASQRMAQRQSGEASTSATPAPQTAHPPPELAPAQPSQPTSLKSRMIASLSSAGASSQPPQDQPQLPPSPTMKPPAPPTLPPGLSAVPRSVAAPGVQSPSTLFALSGPMIPGTPLRPGAPIGVVGPNGQQYFGTVATSDAGSVVSGGGAPVFVQHPNGMLVRTGSFSSVGGAQSMLRRQSVGPMQMPPGMMGSQLLSSSGIPQGTILNSATPPFQPAPTPQQQPPTPQQKPKSLVSSSVQTNIELTTPNPPTASTNSAPSKKAPGPSRQISASQSEDTSDDFSQFDLSKKDAVERLFRDVVESETRAKIIEQELLEEKKLCNELEKVFLNLTKEVQGVQKGDAPPDILLRSLSSENENSSLPTSASFSKPEVGDSDSFVGTPRRTSVTASHSTREIEKSKVDKMTSIIKDQLKQKYLTPIRERNLSLSSSKNSRAPSPTPSLLEKLAETPLPNLGDSFEIRTPVLRIRSDSKSQLVSPESSLHSAQGLSALMDLAALTPPPSSGETLGTVGESNPRPEEGVDDSSIDLNELLKLQELISSLEQQQQQGEEEKGEIAQPPPPPPPPPTLPTESPEDATMTLPTSERPSEMPLSPSVETDSLPISSNDDAKTSPKLESTEISTTVSPLSEEPLPVAAPAPRVTFAPSPVLSSAKIISPLLASLPPLSPLPPPPPPAPVIPDVPRARCIKTRATSAPGELSVVSGEDVKVLDMHESGLWIAENPSGDVGLIPKEFLVMLGPDGNPIPAPPPPPPPAVTAEKPSSDSKPSPDEQSKDQQPAPPPTKPENAERAASPPPPPPPPTSVPTAENSGARLPPPPPPPPRSVSGPPYTEFTDSDSSDEEEKMPKSSSLLAPKEKPEVEKQPAEVEIPKPETLDDARDVNLKLEKSESPSQDSPPPPPPPPPKTEGPASPPPPPPAPVAEATGTVSPLKQPSEQEKEKGESGETEKPKTEKEDEEKKEETKGPKADEEGEEVGTSDDPSAPEDAEKMPNKISARDRIKRALENKKKDDLENETTAPPPPAAAVSSPELDKLKETSKSLENDLFKLTQRLRAAKFKNHASAGEIGNSVPTAALPSIAGLIVEVCDDYEAKSPEELTLKKSEVLKVVNRHQPGVWIGEKLDGTVGQFPSMYVRNAETKERCFESAGGASLSTGGSKMLQDAKGILRAADGAKVDEVTLTPADRAVLMVLLKGATFIRHSPDSLPVERIFMLSPDLKAITWKSTDRKDAQTRQAVQVASIRELRRGLSPAYLETRPTEEREDLATREIFCFSIFTKSRTIELEAYSPEVTDSWVHALLFLLRNRQRIIGDA